MSAFRELFRRLDNQNEKWEGGTEGAEKVEGKGLRGNFNRKQKAGRGEDGEERRQEVNERVPVRLMPLPLLWRWS